MKQSNRRLDRSSGKAQRFGALFKCARQLSQMSLLLWATQSGCAGEDGEGETPGANSGGSIASGGSIGTGGDALSGGSGGASGSGSGGAPNVGSGGVPASGGSGSGGQPAATGGDVGAGGDVGTGGDLGSGGDMGTGGDAGFQPCPETGPCKVLPIGDSITAGYPGEDSYRVKLFQLARDGGYEITFVGTKMAGPTMVDGVSFPRNHEGVNGEKISQIADRVPSPALNDMPHIVLVHAGTNDLPDNLDGAGDRLENLVDELIAGAPDALIVVARIIPIFWAQSEVASYNGTIEPMVQEKVNAGAHVIIVDQFEGFPESDMDDAVHPTVGGYERMAQKWYDGIEPYLR